MTRLMYDAVDWQAIPQDSQLVAGYVDGRRSQWPPNAWYAFPGKVLVRIAVLPTTDDGVVLDVEPEDAEPGDVPAWLTMRRAAGVDPTVYCSPANVDVIKQACAQAGVAEPHWWLSAPGTDATLPDGAVAKQYRWERNVDYSVVADYWPGVDPAQEPAPIILPRNAEFVVPEDEMQTRPLDQGESIAAFNQVAARFGGVVVDNAGETAVEVTVPPPPDGFVTYAFTVKRA